MTKARLTTWINWDPDGTGIGAGLPGPNAVEMDVNVNPGDDPITIVVTEDGVSTSVRTEPTFVTVPDLIFPDRTVGENVAHVLMALRNGVNMTRGNAAFIDLCRQVGIDIDSVEAI